MKYFNETDLATQIENNEAMVSLRFLHVLNVSYIYTVPRNELCRTSTTEYIGWPVSKLIIIAHGYKCQFAVNMAALLQNVSNTRGMYDQITTCLTWMD